MRIELITIGDELLHGRTVNTNAATIGRRLVDAGFELAAQSTIGDEPTALEAHLREVLARADVVITSGGLGSTLDDNTSTVLARLFGLSRWRTDKRVLAYLEKRYQHKAWKPVLAHAKVPVGARVILNRVGTAPGLLFKTKNAAKTAIALPGPPREMTAMLDRVVKFLQRLGTGRGVFRCTTLRVAGDRESILDAKLHKIFPNEPGLSYGLAAEPYAVDIRLFARRSTERATTHLLAKAERIIRRHLGAAIYATGTDTLEQVVVRLLLEQKQTLALAESCTGGLVGRLITNVPGSSDVFRGGVVAYSNEWKTQFLDVPAATIQRFGAVSRETALAMATGIQRAGHTDYAIAITGIAGPGGGTKTKPVGLVTIAVADPAGAECWEYTFPGERETIRTLSARAALDRLRLKLSRVSLKSDATASD